MIPSTLPSPSAAAELRGVTKRFGPALALDDVTFEVRPAAVTGFLGSNGAGKTTALRILLGLSAPTSGSATIGGRPIAEFDEPWRHVGAVLESNDVHPARTGRDHLRVLARLGDETDARVDETLELVGLTGAARRRVGAYSLGMRQRLGLAGAILGRPALLVLDEPANGLDPVGVRWLRDLLRALASDGTAVLMSSHLLAEAEHLVDHVIVLAEGRVVGDRPLAELTATHGSLEDAYLALAAPVTGRAKQ